MTKHKVIATLKVNIELAQQLLQGVIRVPEAKAKTEGIIAGYEFAINLLISKNR